MRIPKSFELFSQKITVEFKDGLYCDGECFGKAYPDQNKIILHGKGEKLPDGKIEQAFLHELVHLILYNVEPDIWRNERIVDNIAGFLHQALKTAKY